MHEEVIKNILASYEAQPQTTHLDTYPLPSRRELLRLLGKMIDLLFPGFFIEQGMRSAHLHSHTEALVADIVEGLTMVIARALRHDHCVNDKLCEICPPDSIQCHHRAALITKGLLAEIPALRTILATDVAAAYAGDPAASSTNEVLINYPGIYAVIVHRLAHYLYTEKVPIIPRMLTEHSHSITGIDIHPGASIGEGFFIDHGTGVVIGETTIIGKQVKLYQGVTLGALSFPKDGDGKIIRNTKRHPTIEDNVTIYAGATILGGDTIIGEGSVIGGNVWLTHSVAAHSRVHLPEATAHPEIRSPLQWTT